MSTGHTHTGHAGYTGHTNTVIRLQLLGVAALSLGLGACGGVAQQDYDQARQEITAQDQKIKALQQQLSAGAVAPAAQPAASSAQSAQSAAPSGQQQGVTTLIGARVLPSPTAAPPPTALPAGAPTATPRVMTATYNEPVGPFTFYVETLATVSLGKDGWASTVACTPNSVFKRGMKLVWRFEVYDMNTGKRVIGDDSPTIKIHIPNVDDVTARFSPRGGGAVPGAPWMWSGGWDIPLDYPLGSLDYTIEVTSKDGRNSSFKTPALVGGPENDSRVKIIA